MKYVKLFEDFETHQKWEKDFDDELENYLKMSVEEKESKKDLINSAIEGSLVGLVDAGINVNFRINIQPNTVSDISIFNFYRKDYKFSDFEDNFNYLYDILMEYNYGIYTISVNNSNLDDELNIIDFDYIWGKIIEKSDDKFVSIKLRIYKK